MAFSMENLKDRGEQIQRTVGEKVKTAEEMRAEIDALKQGLEGMPAGLDDEITSAISEAREAGRREAISDIEGVEGEVEAANQEGAGINAEIDKKISETTSATRKLESIRSTRYGGGADAAIGAARENTSRGEEAKRALEEAMNRGKSDVLRSKSGI